MANIPAASTSAYGVTKLSSSTSSTSTTLAATASAVKSAYDLANSYKGTVTGVKLNGTTYSPTSGVVDLGTISGGSSDANVQAVDTGDVVDDVTIDYATKTYVDGLVGDINSVLESIINGGGNSINYTLVYGTKNLEVGEYLISKYGENYASKSSLGAVDEPITLSGFSEDINGICIGIWILDKVIYLFTEGSKTTYYCAKLDMRDSTPDEGRGLVNLYFYD